ncbi:MAG: hypothetical protein WC159_07125 [Sphaerochaetaceae bacterium]
MFLKKNDLVGFEGKPIIVHSICTGEMSLCLEDRRTGERKQLGCIRNDADLQTYIKQYHLKKDEIVQEW